MENGGDMEGGGEEREGEGRGQRRRDWGEIREREEAKKGREDGLGWWTVVERESVVPMF